MGHSHPPLDYPVFGLDASWPGRRWLQMVQAGAGESSWGTWLMHGWWRWPTARWPWVQVATMPAERFTQLMSPVNRDLARELAFAAAFTLVNCLMPELDDDQRNRYVPRVVRLVEDEAAGHQAWPPITWVVDGDAVSARAWTWAGGWAAFTTAVSGVGIAAVGAGLSPDGLMLAEIGDGSAYHFDMSAPVEFPDTLEASVRAALGGTPTDDDPWPWHEDQLRLLDDSA